MATQVDFALHNSGFCSSHRRNKYSIFASVQLCWPRYGIYYQIVGMGTVGWFFLIAINAAGSVDSKHRQKHGCRGELTMTSSFMN